MRRCRGPLSCVLAASLGMAFLSGAVSPSAAQEHAERVDWRMTMRLHYPQLGIQDTIRLYGPVDMKWFEPYPSPLFPPHFEVDSRIDTVRWWNRTGVWGSELPGMPIVGKAYLLDPEPTVESFFDVTFRIFLPARYPEDTLSLLAPVRTFGFSRDWPPLFDKFESPPGMPPVPMRKESGEIVAEVLSIKFEMIPHYPPETHLTVETAYGSNVALVGADGRIAMSAGLAGNHGATEAVFSFRHCGDPGPFTSFHVDTDGSSKVWATVFPEGSGNGWSASFDPGAEPFEGRCVEFEAAIYVPPYGFFRDTVEVWVDPTPPVPAFHDIPYDSIGRYHVDSFFDITFRLDDELMGPGIGELWTFPLQTDFTRPLTPVDQLGLGTDSDSMSCAPAAGASCLKYFADNGYPGLDNVGGDEARPQMSPEDIARELQGAMGTDSARGTTPDGMVGGIKSYLRKHGQKGWAVGYHPVDDATDLAEMFREFQSDSEDVIVILKDTTAAGDTMGHAVTLGSTHTSEAAAGETPQMRIDFMDPWGGGSQADNDYPLDVESGGRPSTEGYDLNDEGGDAKVAGYVKVSPPEGGSPAPPGRTAAGAQNQPPWMLVASGPVSGYGVVDTLRWNTTGFPGGLYLMEIVTMDDQGFRCRDIRLAWVEAPMTGHDEWGPGSRTMLRGSYPNPFNPSTTIEYSLERSAKVTLAVYDVSGRRVRTLVAGEMRGAGVHAVSWDGKSDGGTRLASGVYFASFTAEGQVSAKKLIMLR